MRKIVVSAASVCALLLLATPLPVAQAQKSKNTTGATALVTDRDALPLSDKFGASMGPIRITPTGDVFFGAFPALFLWDSGTGSRTRLLQGADELPGHPGSVLDTVSGQLRTNAAGHASMVINWTEKGVRNPRGIFVYDGASFTPVATRNSVAPGSGGQVFANFNASLLNDLDEVAFLATFEPIGLGTSGIFMGLPGGSPSKVAVVGEVAPDTGGGTYRNFTLVGFNNLGQVAFLAQIDNGATPFALFLGTPSGVELVVARGEPAAGTGGSFNLPGGAGNYFLNGWGDVAFVSNVSTGERGIWIGHFSGPPTNLVLNSYATGTPLGGTFDGNINIRGFNNYGKVLFFSNPAGATTNHALFLKDLASPAQVVFARGDFAAGGTPGETYGFTQGASLNQFGHVAFGAFLENGPSRFGYFYHDSPTSTAKIVLDGEATPAGGTFGLEGEAFGNPQFNDSGDVAFFADILGPNHIGAFQWTLGYGLSSIVTTNDTLPPGANTIMRQFMPGASDDVLLFAANKAGGRISAFTRPLAGQTKLTRIFSEGDPAPGTGGTMWGLDVASFGVINNNEEVPFGAYIVGATGQYPADGLFTYRPGFGVRKLVAWGDPVPDLPGVVFSDVSGGLNGGRPPARINSQGQVAFLGDLSDGGFGIFVGSATSSPQLVARDGNPTPLGGAFVDFFTPSISDNGLVVFHGTDQSGSVQKGGLFLGSGIFSPVKLIAEGDAGPFGTTVTFVPPRVQINNADQVAYVVGLSGPFITEGVFLQNAGGAPQVVALVNDAAPGAGSGRFSDFDEDEVELNNVGQVAFWARTTDATVRSGYFLGSATSHPVARLVEGQSLPGGGKAGFAAPGINNFIGEQFTLTDAGEMSMHVANLTNTLNIPRGVIANSSGVLREFITPNNAASGTGGSLFGVVFQSVAKNSKGQFFDTVILVGGPAKYGIFVNK